MLYYRSPDRIEHDKAGKLQEIGVPVNQDRFVPALEKMATALVTAVGTIG
jgi:hypothetical protein